MKSNQKLILKNREKDRGCDMDDNESDKHPGKFPTIGKDFFSFGEIPHIRHEIFYETEQDTILLRTHKTTFYIITPAVKKINLK